MTQIGAIDAALRAATSGATRDGARLLARDTVRRMGENHIGDLVVTPLRSAIPEASNHLELFPEQEKKWGLSFPIDTQQTAEGRSAASLA